MAKSGLYRGILWSLLLVVLVVAALAVVGLFLPSEFKVERSVVIDAPVERVFPYISNLKEWRKWSPWSELEDPTVTYSYSGPQSGENARLDWAGEVFGTGHVVLTEVKPNVLVRYKLAAGEDFFAKGEIKLEPSGGATRVTWGDSGNVGGNLIARYFILLVDSRLGAFFEKGLTSLRSVVMESRKES